MMDWTDRNCRAFHRHLSRHALLYTEMVTADAILHGDMERLLGYDQIEHPVALQLGGSEPAKLAHAARIGAEIKPAPVRGGDAGQGRGPGNDRWALAQQIRAQG
jgi:tRNA-dihydrouridine synthase